MFYTARRFSIAAALLIIPQPSSSTIALFIGTKKMLQTIASRRVYLHHVHHHYLRKSNSIFFSTTPRQSFSTSHSAVAPSDEDENQVTAQLDPYEVLKLNKIPLPSKLSPTSLECFTKCHQAFFFLHILKLKPDPPMTPELARGIICHKALEDVFDLTPPQRTLENLQNLFRREWSEKRRHRQQHQQEQFNNDGALKNENSSESESYDSLFRIDDNGGGIASNATSPYDIDAEIDWGQTSLQMLKNYYELEDPRNVTPLMREMWVHAKFPTCDTESDAHVELRDGEEDPHFIVRGKIDRIDIMLRSNNHEGAILRIIDYKTGKKPHFKYSAATNERISNEQFWKMKVYALVLHKMILQSEAIEQMQSEDSSENSGKDIDYRFGLSWELRQKLLQRLGYENEKGTFRWSELVSIDSLRLMYLTSHLDDMAANYNIPADATIGKAAYLEYSLNEFIPLLDQTEKEVISIQRQIKELVEMQDPRAWHHCSWKYCSCHEMRDRFINGTVSNKIM